MTARFSVMVVAILTTLTRIWGDMWTFRPVELQTPSQINRRSGQCYCFGGNEIHFTKHFYCFECECHLLSAYQMGKDGWRVDFVTHCFDGRLLSSADSCDEVVVCKMKTTKVHTRFKIKGVAVFRSRFHDTIPGSFIICNSLWWEGNIFSEPINLFISCHHVVYLRLI